MEGATAQVTPLELTTKLMQAAVDKGATVVTGEVEGVERGGGGQGVRVHVHVHATSAEANAGRAGKQVVEGDAVVITMGPWSGVFCEDHFGMKLPMDGVKSTSLVYQGVGAIRAEPFACFCEEDANSCEPTPALCVCLHICMCVWPRPVGGTGRASG